MLEVLLFIPQTTQIDLHIYIYIIKYFDLVSSISYNQENTEFNPCSFILIGPSDIPIKQGMPQSFG